MKIVVVLNVVALALTAFLSSCNANEFAYVFVYLFEAFIDVYLYLCCKSSREVYLRKVWLMSLIIGSLIVSNILVVLLHEDVKWIARFFFLSLSISYLISIFSYMFAWVRGRAKLIECCATTLTIITVLLTSLPVFPYYRLSYSAKYQNNLLVYRHYTDALYEETLILQENTHSYVKIINQGGREVSIYYDCYPDKVSHVDTTFINNNY